MVSPKVQPAAPAGRVPLTSRPKDLFYFCWFVFHIPLSALIDGQIIYSTSIVSSFARKLYLQALDFAKDPFLIAVEAGDENLGWFKSLVYLEVIFQIPVFFVGAYSLYQNDKRVYPLLLIYASSCFTTLIPCIVYLTNLLLTFQPHLNPFPHLKYLPHHPNSSSKISSHPHPNSHTAATAGIAINRLTDYTLKDYVATMSTYVPFALIAGFMVVDMAGRLGRIVNAGLKAERAKKSV